MTFTMEHGVVARTPQQRIYICNDDDITGILYGIYLFARYYCYYLCVPRTKPCRPNDLNRKRDFGAHRKYHGSRPSEVVNGGRTSTRSRRGILTHAICFALVIGKK